MNLLLIALNFYVLEFTGYTTLLFEINVAQIVSQE